MFRNTARPITEPGKGSYWELDISQGEGYKRARKRRNKKQRQGSDSGSMSADDEEFSDTSSSLRRSESPSGRSRSAEMGSVTLGPFRTVHAGPTARRSSPYPQSNATQTRFPAPVQAYAAEYSRGTPPQAWAMDQVLPGQYHQAQPYPYAPFPLPANNQNLQTVFSSAPIANTVGWQAQMRSTSASSQLPYASNMSPVSSSMSGHGQLGGPSLQPGYMLHESQGGGMQYPGFGQNQAFEEQGYDTESSLRQGGGRRYHG